MIPIITDFKKKTAQ